jgi:hypothetical protein
MATNHNHIRDLIDKLESLPPECIAEVEDFIAFLKSRDVVQQLVRTATKASEAAFAQTWDNPDDTVYDTL